MRKHISTFTILVLLFISNLSYSQDYKKFKPVNTGFEFQWYPAGIIPSIESDWIIKNHWVLNTRVGINIADRKDFSGLNDSEKGDAWGGSLGVRYYKSDQFDNFYLGLRSDLWDMRIDWIKNGPPKRTGFTDILILQPTVEIGYLYPLKNSKWKIGVDAALGFEINVISEGEDVGQGRVSLLSAKINRTF